MILGGANRTARKEQRTPQLRLTSFSAAQPSPQGGGFAFNKRESTFVAESVMNQRKQIPSPCSTIAHRLERGFLLQCVAGLDL